MGGGWVKPDLRFKTNRITLELRHTDLSLLSPLSSLLSPSSVPMNTPLSLPNSPSNSSDGPKSRSQIRVANPGVKSGSQIRVEIQVAGAPMCGFAFWTSTPRVCFLVHFEPPTCGLAFVVIIHFEKPMCGFAFWKSSLCVFLIVHLEPPTCGFACFSSFIS